VWSHAWHGSNLAASVGLLRILMPVAQGPMTVKPGRERGALIVHVREEER